MKAGTPFAERICSGVHRAFQRPTAVRPSRGGGSSGVGVPSHPAVPSLHPHPRPAETVVWARASADSSTLFTEVWERSLGIQAPLRGGRGRSQAVTDPRLGSQPSPPHRGPRSPHTSDGGARMPPSLSPLQSSSPEGCARGTQKGLSECGFRCPFLKLFAQSPLLETLPATPGDRISYMGKAGLRSQGNLTSNPMPPLATCQLGNQAQVTLPLEASASSSVKRGMKQSRFSFVNVTNQVLNSCSQSPLPVYRCGTG